MIDEFDQTLNDVLPFYALPDYVIQHRALQLQNDPSTFTMRIKNGKNEIIGAHKGDGRAKDQAKLMERWTKWVPDVNITMSAHDGPSVMLDQRSRSNHMQAALKGECKYNLAELSISFESADLNPLQSCLPPSWTIRTMTHRELDRFAELSA